MKPKSPEPSTDRPTFLENVSPAGGGPGRPEAEGGTLVETIARSAPSSPGNPIRMESTIGPYQLIQPLGEGGMGSVFRARQSQPIQRDVALKVIKPGMDSREIIARFESERQAVAMMDHPNIARVYDAGTTERGLPYFVMELVEGVPITHYCDSRRLTFRERIELFLPVCQAIQHAHQKGIIHRDIKPSNILVKELENQSIPKVIDFGLAKALGNQPGSAGMTTAGTVVGTLDYMSPEQADLGRQDVDTRTDVYSLGAVLYELLTGETPLRHEAQGKNGYVEILQRIREEEPPPPSARLLRCAEPHKAADQRRCQTLKLPRELSRELDWITLKALEKDPARRYETVNGFARDLQRYRDGEPVEAAPPSRAYRMGKFVRKYRLWIATAAAFTAVLIAGIVVSAWMAVRAARAENEARAVSDFLRNDLLAQASPDAQAQSSSKPDPNLKVRTALDRAASKMEGRFPAQPSVEAAIQHTIGSTYLDLGLYPEAEQHLDRALRLRRQVLGENHSDTLVSMDRLAKAYDDQAKYGQGEPLRTRTLEIRRRMLGSLHPDTLKSMNSLASHFIHEGNFARAESLLTEAREGQRRVLSPRHLDTLNTMNNLAVVYFSQGKYAPAERQFAEVLEYSRQVQGKEHPDTLMSLNNLAGVCHIQSKYAQAETLYKEALELHLRVLGPDHPDTLMLMANRAELYRDRGDYDLAEPSFGKALDALQRVLGPEHPNTLQVTLALAEMYRVQGKYVQAESLFGRILETRRRTRGADHPRTADALVYWARVQLQQQNYPQAEKALSHALQIYEKNRRDDWMAYSGRSLLGACLAGQKKYSEAEPLLIRGHEGLVQRKDAIPTWDQAAIGDAEKWIGNLYRDWGRPEKAAEWIQKNTVVQEEKPHGN